MASPKATRSAPTRIFENYVLTSVIGKNMGLSPIPNKLFQRVPGDSDGSLDDGLSEFVPIGFDFVFDQVTYKKCIVSTNGWLILADSAATNVFTVVTQLLLAGTYENHHINLNNTSNSVLLCAWFDDLKNVAKSATAAGGSALSEFRANYGIDTPALTHNHTTFGMRMFRDDRSPEGRRVIFRWHSLSDLLATTSIIAFECILYENGTIEYRYDKRQNLGITTPEVTVQEDATIGVFGRGTNRFRDFAYVLGKTQNRREYKYGGAIYASDFSDQITETFPTSSLISQSYTISLTSRTNWPGQMETGAIFRFMPPMNRLKVLPKKLLQEHDSYDDFDLFFDDRRTPWIVTGTVVNYPSTLPRFFGNSEAGVAQRQSLFNGSSNELELTGSIVKSAIDQHLRKVPIFHAKPFDESAEFNQETTFFASGSDVVAGHRLDQPLWSKAQVKFSLPVDYITTLFPTTASIYYYNTRSKSWMLPRNSVVNGSDLTTPESFATNRRVIEDHRGFGPVGNLLGSGSNEPTSTQGTDIVINAPYSTVTVLGQSVGVFESITRPLTKTILVNSSYQATNDELFQYPTLDHPFLLEKAVFEIPFAAGTGWFNDKTTSFLPLVSNTGSFDFAGPGLTVALLNQIQVGSTTRRDLIMTGTITHSDDNVATIELSSFQPYSADSQLRPVGFRAYGLPSCVVTRPASSIVTGTLRVETEALISNGITLRMSKDMMSATPATNRQELLSLIDQEKIFLKSSSAEFSTGFNVAYINGLGRSGVGRPSPRSILGGEFVTSQGTVVDSTVKNPFYLTGSARDQIASLVADTTRARAVAAVSLETHIRSPYLIMPGDKLVLAVAKSRPYYYSNGLGGPEFSGSIAHDFQLMSGTINVTLYGSYLQEEAVIPQQPSVKTSNVIRDTIGNEPVLNQYDGHYFDEYIGSMTDDYVTGTLVAKTVDSNGRFTLITGERGRVTSKSSARLTPSTDVSYSTFLQPWFERAGMTNIASHVDSAERYWDSLMPGIDKCMILDGARIFKIRVGAASPNPYVVYTGGGNFTSSMAPADNIGFMLFDYQYSSAGDWAGFGPESQDAWNSNWTKAFPFEPRYASVPRQSKIEKSFVATQRYNSVTDIEPTLCDSLIVGVREYTLFHVEGESGDELLTVDINLAQTSTLSTLGEFITGSASSADTLKCLFGFGDYNNCFIETLDPSGSVGGPFPIRFGTNHWPTFRHYIEKGTRLFAISPVIRGWKYGVVSAFPTNNRAHYRASSYGQFRDMLEQRPFTKFFATTNKKNTITSSPVQVKFVTLTGEPTRPENTQSQNLDIEATSSVPYFDGEIRNRTDLNPNTQNTNVVGLTADSFNNVAL